MSPPPHAPARASSLTGPTTTKCSGAVFALRVAAADCEAVAALSAETFTGIATNVPIMYRTANMRDPGVRGAMSP